MVKPIGASTEQQTIVRQLDALKTETQKLEAIYLQKLLNLEELKKSILRLNRFAKKGILNVLSIN
jgi:type I restriction enzyme S subunit